MEDSSVGGSDNLTLGGSESGVNTSNFGGVIYGDANQMFDQTRGGADLIHAGGARSPTPTTVYGDAGELHGSAAGGADTIAGDAAQAFLSGDGNLYDNAQGGNDRIYYEVSEPVYPYFPVFSATIYGEGPTIQGAARAGSDAIGGSAGSDVIYGDARTISGTASGGDDSAGGGRGNDTIYGDAFTLGAGTRGGNDSLFGGSGDDTIYGDAAALDEAARGGNDILTGDSGADKFYFVGHFGTDTVLDFDRGSDQLVFVLPTPHTLTFATVTLPDGNQATVITAPGDYGSVVLPYNQSFYGNFDSNSIFFE